MLDNIVIRGSFIKCVTFKTNSKDIRWQNKLFGVDGLFLMNSTDNMKLLRICWAFYLHKRLSAYDHTESNGSSQCAGHRWICGSFCPQLTKWWWCASPGGSLGYQSSHCTHFYWEPPRFVGLFCGVDWLMKRQNGDASRWWMVVKSEEYSRIIGGTDVVHLK